MEYDDIYLSEEQNNIEIEETIEVIDVSDTATYTVDSDVAFPPLGEPNEYLKHQLLNGRELPDQHPITAITGLRDELDDIEALDVVYSDKRNQANYYLWEDENVFQDNRVGYFVSACSDINEIKICTSNNDIFGVTVDSAGFVGAQDNIARDIKYGIVVTTGVVHVRCEQSVNVGDYVISNDYGYAQKNKNGYKVVGRHLIDGVEYAEITLVTPIGRMCELTDNVEKLNDRMDDAETNIVAAINVANAAYNKAGEADNVSEEAIKNALEALNKSNETAERTNNIELNAALANEMAVQAKTISESAAVTAESIRKEAVATANDALANAYNTQDNLDELIDEMAPLTQWEGENGSGIVGFVARANADSATLASLAEWSEGGDSQSIAGTIAKVNEHEAVLDHITSHQGMNSSTIAQVEQKADDNGASITSLVSSVDKYSVGEYSQAYGLTREQAASILKPGYIYIPTKHDDSQSHSEIFVGESEVNEFTPGDYYVWGINDQGNADWIEHSVGSVWISSAIPANSNGVLQYWYLDSNTPPAGYEAYALYMWKEGQWKKVNTLAGNASNRAVSMIRQTTNEIAAEVTNARGSYAGLNARLEADNKAQVAMVASVVNSDGTVNAASIVNSVNESGSFVTINGDHIVLNGATTNGDGSFQIHENGYMIATGGTIGGWNIGKTSISTDGVTLNKYGHGWAITAGDLTEDSVYKYPLMIGHAGELRASSVSIKGHIEASTGKIGMWEIGEDGSLIGTNNGKTTGMEPPNVGVHAIAVGSPNRNSWGGAPFRVLHDGTFYATAAHITGEVTATTGKIADYTISGAKLVGTNVGMCSDESKGWAFWAGKAEGSGAPFRVGHNGVLWAEGAQISGTLKAGSVVVSSDSEDANPTKLGLLYFKNNPAGNGVTLNTANCFPGTSGYNQAGMVFADSILQLSTTNTQGGHSAVYLYGSGDGRLAGTWAYTDGSSGSLSDIRHKNSIETLGNNFDLLFDKIEPIRYKYNKGTSNRYHLGYIAQQIEQAIVNAELSEQDAALVIDIRDHDNYGNELDTFTKYLRYEEFVALNTWQIQKAKARITKLETRIEQLEKLLEEKGEV